MAAVRWTVRLRSSRRAAGSDMRARGSQVTLIPRGQARGLTWFIPGEDPTLISKQQIFARIVGALGGRATEEVIFGDAEVTTGASSDLQMVRRAGRMRGRCMMLQQSGGCCVCMQLVQATAGCMVFVRHPEAESLCEWKTTVCGPHVVSLQVVRCSAAGLTMQQ